LISFRPTKTENSSEENAANSNRNILYITNRQKIFRYLS
jgi:hypothetical protein